MRTRIALYHRWRRYQVTSLTYPLLLCVGLGVLTCGLVLIL